jgi:hypothetical protein
VFRKHALRVTILNRTVATLADFNMLLILSGMQFLFISVITMYLNFTAFNDFLAALCLYYDIALNFGDGL